MKKLIVFCSWLVLFPCICLAQDIYISQTNKGTDTGAFCSNSHSINWLNSAANWANPKQTGKIGPGDTVHLCDTISTPLAFLGSGTSGNPITILFEAGAKFSAPTWTTGTEAISCSSKSYLVIDGGNNGIIEATDTGSPAMFGGTFTYQNDLRGIYLFHCTNVEIKNLTIRNLYQRVASSVDCNAYGTGVRSTYEANNLKIHDTSISGTYHALLIAYGATTVSGVEVYNNTFSDNNLALQVGPPNNGTYSLEGMKVYNNYITGGQSWDGTWPTSGCGCASCGDGRHHQNAMQFFTQGYANVTNNDLKVYNNYCQDFGTHATSHIQITDAGTNNPLIYNNILVLTGANRPGNGVLRLTHTTNAKVYNNTFSGDGPSSASGIWLDTTTGTDIKNNIISNIRTAIYSVSTASLTSNYNDIYGNDLGFYRDGKFVTLSAWLGLGYDTQSVTVDPRLDSKYMLTSSSPVGVHSGGMNLSSIFTTDKKGAIRPSIGWSIGAYQITTPQPPQLLN
jgi:hypothetical protein